MKIINGNITTPKGFKATGLASGIKQSGKPDLAILLSDTPASAAGVYTTNKTTAAPIRITREHLENPSLRGVVVNSGNANASTGKLGLENAVKMTEFAASKYSLNADDFAVASTGVIGVQLPLETIEAGIEQIEITEDGGSLFADAILTTDTFKKEVCVDVDGKYTIAGCAKGSGMIHPNMGTMLSFITTDASIHPTELHHLLKEVTDVTFNQITVDGDTSTNDTVVVLANGASGVEAGSEFKEALELVMGELARMIAKDGEGATKLIEVEVVNALDFSDARMAAKAVVGSSLVKAAMYGEDPNWGRIMCAVGYSGAEVDPDICDVDLQGIKVFENGTPIEFDVQAMSKELKKDFVKIVIDFKQGAEKGKAWGCDLTYDYVKINALYTT